MIAPMATPASRIAAGSVGTVDTQFLDLPKPLALDCGRTLHPIRIAYETYGTLSPARDNVILVCHALSGDAHAAGFAKTPPPESTRDGFAAEDRDGTAGRGLGWWDGMIGPGKAFDTDQVFRCQHQSPRGMPRDDRTIVRRTPRRARPYGSDFPVITVADMVRTERAFLDELGIARLAAVAGGSLGGMQALEWAILYPDQVDAIVVIASTHALQPQGLAWNAIARNAITTDPDWQGGHYYGTGRPPNAGMGVARMVGHITYLVGEIARRQVRPASAVRRRHPLHAHGSRVRSRKLSSPPGGDLRPALRRKHVPLHLAGADVLRSGTAVRQRRRSRTRCATSRRERCSSRSAPTGCIRLRGPRSWRRRSRAEGKDVEFHVIDAPYGHDCFLLEEARQTPMIQNFLGM